jgi:hypothetical protein
LFVYLLLAEDGAMPAAPLGWRNIGPDHGQIAGAGNHSLLVGSFRHARLDRPMNVCVTGEEAAQSLSRFAIDCPNCSQRHPARLRREWTTRPIF